VSRGKHAARRAAEERRKIKSLSDLIDSERSRLEAAERQEQTLRELKQKLHDETAALEAGSRAHVTQLVGTGAAVTVTVGDLEQAVNELDEAWQKLRRKVSGRLGSSHTLSSLLTGAPTLSLASLDGVRSEAPAAVLKVHTGGFLPAQYTGTVDPLAWFADWLPEPAHLIGAQLRQLAPLTVRGVHTDVDLPEPLATSAKHVRRLVDLVAGSTIDSFEPYCLAAWNPLPWLACVPSSASGHDEQARRPSQGHSALGTLSGLNPNQRPTTREPADAVRARGRDWTAQHRRVRSSRRLPTPWAPRPAFLRPRDAEALKCWYRRDALSDWATVSTFAETLQDLHDQNPQLGEARDLQGAISLAQLLTEQLDQSALYWLPPGHAAAHADGESLPSDALPDLRLPYPSVLLTCADPLVLPPVETTTTEAYQRKLIRARSALPDTGPPPTWRAWASAQVYTPDDADRDATLPTLDELLDHEGALVEAVLLLADATGRPLDLFAWCLAIPDRETGQIFARAVMPAERSRTIYADVVNNMIAVVGWAEWHEPGAAPSAAGTIPTDRGLSDNYRRDDVHVLRTGRGASWTRPPTLEVLPPRGHVRPHRRRAHWRRQHHGPGKRLVKMIRVAPTIVNAHAGPLSVQIYRLPMLNGEQS
jgi:hypothetical protein